MALYACYNHSIVVTMYIDDCTYKRGKRTYRRLLLRESRRVNGKVVKRTVANITDWPELLREAIVGAVGRGRDESVAEQVATAVGGQLVQGKSVGAVATVLRVARELGICAALGDDRQGRLALFQVVARVIDQGSRLSAVRMARSHAAAELIGLSGFDEDDLYENLSWLSTRQVQIEDALFRMRYPGQERPALFLYDVTSSYFEGEHNALAAFGYNRDRKSGKRQIVVGLLTDHEGRPLSVEVFAGNTADPATVPSQVSKLRDRFGGKDLTLVGDRGMLKAPQRTELGDVGMRYLTAITRAQIESMLKRGTCQMERFDRQIAEVTDPGAGVRYILRRNPAQADRMEKRRVDQQRSWQSAMERANEHLGKQARPETAVRNLSARATRLKLSGWLSVEADGRKLRASIDEQARVESAKLDGCYVLQTDLPATAADARTVDARYHDLSKVEWAFRTAKTTHLEIRPIHLRREDRTRAHALVVTLAYLITRHLAERWSGFDCTVEEGIGELAQLCSVQTILPDGTTLIEIPQPRPHLAKLLEAAAVQLPTLSHTPPPRVVTKRKPNTRRK
jgi:hypothetical protein